MNFITFGQIKCSSLGQIFLLVELQDFFSDLGSGG